MLGTIRADTGLVHELRFWLGQNIFAERAFPQARELAQAARTAISSDTRDDR